MKFSGKQYSIQNGSKIVCDRINSNSKIQPLFAYDNGKILLNNEVNNISIKYEVESNYRGKKIIVFKKRRRKHHKKTHGHRQNLTSIKIQEIKL